jgi:hypothetical protein
MVFVLIYDLTRGWVGPLFKSGTQVLLLRPEQGLKLLAVVDVGQFCDLSDKVIEISLPFVGNLIIDDTDALFWNGGDEAPREPLDDGNSHLKELIKSSEDIDLPVFIFSFDVIGDVLGEGTSLDLVFGDMQSNSLSKFTLLLEN